MKTVIVVFLLFLQGFCASAYQTFDSSQALLAETTLDPEDIEKVTNLLENPKERKKILKALKALAKVKTLEEKKPKKNLTNFLNPFIEGAIDNLSEFLLTLQTIPYLIKDNLHTLSSQENRKNFWEALKWLPVFLIITLMLEAMKALWTKYRFSRKNIIHSNTNVNIEQTNNRYYNLLFSFVISPLIFMSLSHYFFGNSGNIVIKYLLILWLIYFVGRICYLMWKTPFVSIPSQIIFFSRMNNKTQYYLKAWTLCMSLILWVIILYTSIDTNNYDQDTITILILILSLPSIMLIIKQWQATSVPHYINQSTNLLTAPRVLKSFINTFISYTLWTLLVIGYASSFYSLVIGEFSEQGVFTEIALTCLLYFMFLRGRYKIDQIAHKKIPGSDSTTVKPYMNYIHSHQVRFAKILQWIWHLTCIIALLAIWNNSFSDLFLNLLSYPATKTLLSLGVVWGICFVIWTIAESIAGHYMQTRPSPDQNQPLKLPTPFAKTFGPMLHSIVRWVIGFGAFFITLEHFGLDLKLLVYLMSALALAISLGAQSLVKDVINGIFALIDGSFAVGEVVSVGTHTGRVESLSLRALTLRHSTGCLQTIPFSEVGSIINRSRDYTVVPIAIATSYKTKIDNVYEALQNTAREMMSDAHFGKMIIDPPTAFGIDKFDENAVYVSASFKIKPDPSNTFSREFNRRLKAHMEALNVMPPTSFYEESAKEPAIL